MRNWKVVGFKKINYTSRKTNRMVDGFTIYLSSDPETPDITGQEMKEIYLSSSATAYRPALNDKVNVIYNDRGFVEDIIKKL